MNINNDKSTFSSSTVEHGLIVSAGPLLGATVGAVQQMYTSGADVFYNGGEKLCYSALKGFPVLDYINILCEGTYSPLTSIPMCAVGGIACANLVLGNDVNNEGGVLKASAKNIYYGLVVPNLYRVPVVLGGFFMRELIRDYMLQEWGIDVSGHAIMLTSSAISSFFTLEYFSKLDHSKQEKTIEALMVLLGLGDIIWTYHTTAHCHSVIDVVVGAGCVAIPAMSLVMGHKAIEKTIAKTWNVASSCFSYLIGSKVSEEGKLDKNSLLPI